MYISEKEYNEKFEKLMTELRKTESKLARLEDKIERITDDLEKLRQLTIIKNE